MGKLDVTNASTDVMYDAIWFGGGAAGRFGSAYMKGMGGVLLLWRRKVWEGNVMFVAVLLKIMCPIKLQWLKC